MAFKPLKYDNGMARMLKLAISQTILKGDGLIDNGSGYLEADAAGGEATEYVALEAVTTGAGATGEVLCVPALRSGIRFEVDCSADLAEAQKFLAYELKTVRTIDNETTASDNGFVIEEIVYPLTAKKCIGYWR
jgi:hypothetical protein